MIYQRDVLFGEISKFKVSKAYFEQLEREREPKPKPAERSKQSLEETAKPAEAPNQLRKLRSRSEEKNVKYTCKLTSVML